MSNPAKGSAVKLSLVDSGDPKFPRVESLDSSLLQGLLQCFDKALVLAVSDSNGEFIFVSPSFVQLSGFENSELLGKSHRILNSNLHSTLFWKQMWESLQSGQTWRGEIRNRKKSGEYFWTDTTIVPTKVDGYSDFVYVEFRQDITLKKHKEMMQESHANLHKLFADIPDKQKMFQHLLSEILQVTESEWVVGVEVSPNEDKPYDLKSFQIQYGSGVTGWDLKPEEYRDFLKIFDPVIQNHRPLYIHQGHSNRRTQGTWNPAVHKFSSFLGLPIQSGHQVLGVIGLANRRGGYKESTHQNWKPICEMFAQSLEKFEHSKKQKKLESELKNHLILLEQSQEVAGIGGWIYEIDAQEVYWTRQLYILFGCDPTVFKPNISSLSAFVEPNAAETLSDKIQGLVQRLEEFDITVPVSSSFGEGRWIRVFGKPQYDNGKVQRVLGAVQEVTQLKRKEQQVDDQRKKALANSRATALGQMAGGIAHEINNPLTIVLGTAKHFKISCDREELSKEVLHKGADKIIAATTRISKVIKGLKAFAREGSKDPIIDCSVQMIFDDTFSFCEARVRNHGITLEAPQLSQDYRLRCRPVEIAQALLNLILNSDSAVRGSTTPWIRVTFEQDKEWSLFRVTDSGKGISKTIADKMMEPFYTTKEPGMGMGLGLSVVNSIVVSHSGQFYLDTNILNTSFVIKIPR